MRLPFLVRDAPWFGAVLKTKLKRGMRTNPGNQKTGKACQREPANAGPLDEYAGAARGYQENPPPAANCHFFPNT
jgi:hypothetical protein